MAKSITPKQNVSHTYCFLLIGASKTKRKRKGTHAPFSMTSNMHFLATCFLSMPFLCHGVWTAFSVAHCCSALLPVTVLLLLSHLLLLCHLWHKHEEQEEEKEKRHSPATPHFPNNLLFGSYLISCLSLLAGMPILAWWCRLYGGTVPWQKPGRKGQPSFTDPGLAW